MIIVVPIVTKNLKSTKDSIYDSMINRILSSAVDYASLNSKVLPSEGENIDITLGMLQSLGLISTDLKNPKTNVGNAGFTNEERGKMSELLNAGFIDTFRYLYPDKENVYTWWSYMFHAREKNVGWRIDYFITSKSLKKNIKDAIIYDNILGSDHCPIGLEIEV